MSQRIYILIFCLVIVFGVLGRASLYLSNRSLWLDEAIAVQKMSSNSIYELGLLFSRSFGKKLPYPIGYLFIQKTLIHQFGNAEMVVRFFPFVCSLLGLFVYWKLLKCMDMKRAGLIAMTLLCLSGHLIYYSSEVKPYICDMTISMLLLLLLFRIQTDTLTSKRILFYAVVGMCSVWFSFPAMFFLFGGGGCVLILHLIKKEYTKVKQIFLIISLWMLSFATYFFASLRYHDKGGVLTDNWESSFVPIDKGIDQSLVWFGKYFYKLFEDPGGLYMPILGCGLFILGIIYIGNKKLEKGYVLISILGAVLLASLLKKYPFEGRLSIFAMPIFYIIIAFGWKRLYDMTRESFSKIPILALVLLFLHPVLVESYHVFRPMTHEEIKPVLQHIDDNMQKGDVVYVYIGAYHAYTYYKDRYGIEQKGRVVANKQWADDKYGFTEPELVPKNLYGIKSIKKQYQLEMGMLSDYPRLWVLFAHVSEAEEKWIVDHLLQSRSLKDRMIATKASTYLFENKSDFNNGVYEE